jgi:hypothetical protein
MLWRQPTLLALVLWLAQPPTRADWPMLHGNAQHTGFVPTDLRPPFRLAWARHFIGERLGTAMEPIVSGDKVFVATHQGSLWALESSSGQPRWRFRAQGPFLHSPACGQGLVLVGCADGNLYGVEINTGRERWHVFGGYGGFTASPVIADGLVCMGTRSGKFLGVDLRSGKTRWSQPLGAPIRQTAAAAGGRVYVTGEDLRARCFDAGTGRVIWTSEALAGQTARDYYPILTPVAAGARLILRSNPLLNMGQLIGRERTLLCQNAGVDDRTWQKVEAWCKSQAARGDAGLWAREQQAVIQHLEQLRETRTFFVLDAASGQEMARAPVLWIGGCQGVGAPPALTADGRLLVFFRSAYGNWNLGVAPLVALGLLDLAQNRITPLFHQHGAQPPWNTFWGTADESQNFVVAGHTALIVHQGTLSGFDLTTHRLFRLHGERDTYGGFASPPWARNEWHGPGRGGVAVVDQRVYWLTGSRLLCLVAGAAGPAPEAVGLEGTNVPTHKAQATPPPSSKQIQQWLAEAVSEALSQKWAPLFLDPGLAGREFAFDDSAELFEALAWAYPHLPGALQKQAQAVLAEEWAQHPPWTQQAWYSLKQGTRREWFWTPESVWTRLGQDKAHHPFGNVSAVELYARRCGEEQRVLTAWPELKASFEDFLQSRWRLDGARGDLHANRYLGSLMAFRDLARRAGDNQAAAQAELKAAETAEALASWWERAARSGTLTQFKGSSQLDPFIASGDALSFRITPHRHKVALFSGLTPQVAAAVKARAADAADRVWETFSRLYATWPLVGEERQAHFGENVMDPPDLALSAFCALAWLRGESAQELSRRIDLPLCRADLYYVTKLALTLEARNRIRSPRTERQRVNSKPDSARRLRRRPTASPARSFHPFGAGSRTRGQPPPGPSC